MVLTGSILKYADNDKVLLFTGRTARTRVQ